MPPKSGEKSENTGGGADLRIVNFCPQMSKPRPLSTMAQRGHDKTGIPSKSIYLVPTLSAGQ